MGIQFLDMRIAQDSAADLPGLSLSSSSMPYVFGDIGIQTAHVAPGNESLVRVTLNAYARLTIGGPSGPMTDDVTFIVSRNGTQIFSTTYPGTLTAADPNFELAGITVADFPPASAVLTGQIRYTIAVVTTRFVTLGARSFSGIAVAGNT